MRTGFGVFRLFKQQQRIRLQKRLNITTTPIINVSRMIDVTAAMRYVALSSLVGMIVLLRAANIDLN